VARRSLQEARAELRFELFDGLGHGRARQAQILRGLGEAAPLDDVREDPQGFEFVHRLFPNSE